MQQVLDNDLFSAEFLMDDLYKSLNATEMARRKFRDIAVVAGLVFTGYPNKLVKSKHLQSSSQLLFDVFRDYEDDNLLFQQAFRETFEHQLEEGRLRLALERIHQQKIVWNIKNPKGILLDEIDSGLDIDAVKDVAGFITSISNKDNAIMIVTHYSRILKYLEISKVHIIVDGKIVLSGDSEIIEQIDSDGYSQFQEG